MPTGPSFISLEPVRQSSPLHPYYELPNSNFYCRPADVYSIVLKRGWKGRNNTNFAFKISK